jgi:hypothetical protein
MAFCAAGLPGPARASASVSRFQITCMASDKTAMVYEYM